MVLLSSMKAKAKGPGGAGQRQGRSLVSIGELSADDIERILANASAWEHAVAEGASTKVLDGQVGYASEQRLANVTVTWSSRQGVCRPSEHHRHLRKAFDAVTFSARFSSLFSSVVQSSNSINGLVAPSSCR